MGRAPAGGRRCDAIGADLPAPFGPTLARGRRTAELDCSSSALPVAVSSELRPASPSLPDALALPTRLAVRRQARLHAVVTRSGPAPSGPGHHQGSPRRNQEGPPRGELHQGTVLPADTPRDSARSKSCPQGSTTPSRVHVAPAGPADDDYWIDTYVSIVRGIMERAQERHGRRGPAA